MVVTVSLALNRHAWFLEYQYSFLVECLPVTSHCSCLSLAGAGGFVLANIVVTSENMLIDKVTLYTVRR